MKKLITLLLVLTGYVCTASATKLYVNVDNLDAWWFNDNATLNFYSFDSDNESDKTDWDYQNSVNPTFMYGGRWYIYEMPTNHDRAIVRRWVNSGVANQTYDITVEEDSYIYLKSGDDKLSWDVVSSPAWTGLCVRSSVDGYEGYVNNMDCSNNYNTFTKTYNKSDFGEATTFWFRLKHIENVKFGENGTWYNTWTQVGPTSNDTPMSFASTITTQNQFSDDTGNNWQITLPTYDYEKIVLTVNYINEDGSYKWEVSADAYITKTVSGTNKYATLGCSVPLEIVEANSVTAYPLTANASTGKITKGEAITTIPANEGALLENETGSDQTIRAKVLSSADASPANHLVAFTGTGNLTQPGEGNTYYILSKKDNHVGFYKVNTTSGNAMGANTAYLSVAVGTSSRSAFFFDDETTGIEAIDSNSETVKEGAREYYNLNGQRVMNPSKGLYIVNGKKVIIK